MNLCVFTWNKQGKFKLVGTFLAFLIECKSLGLLNEGLNVFMSSRDKNHEDIAYTCKQLGIPFLIQKYDSLEGVEDYKGNCLSLLLQCDTILYEDNDKEVYMRVSARAMRKHLVEIDFTSENLNFTREQIAEMFKLCKQ